RRVYDTLVVVDGDNAARGLTMAVKRRRAFDSVSKSALEIGLDFGQLASRVRAFVDPHLADYEALKSRYGKYLTPGTLLRDELGDFVADLVAEAFGEEPALKQLAQALAGDDADENALRAHLVEKLVGRAGGAGDALAGW